MRGAGGTLTRPASAFLLPGFATAAGDFTAAFGLVRAQASICHLAHVSLVHQIDIHCGLEDRGGQIHAADLLAFHVQDIYFHVT